MASFVLGCVGIALGVGITIGHHLLVGTMQSPIPTIVFLFTIFGFLPYTVFSPFVSTEFQKGVFSGFFFLVFSILLFVSSGVFAFFLLVPSYTHPNEWYVFASCQLSFLFASLIFTISSTLISIWRVFGKVIQMIVTLISALLFLANGLVLFLFLHVFYPGYFLMVIILISCCGFGVSLANLWTSIFIVPFESYTENDFIRFGVDLIVFVLSVVGFLMHLFTILIPEICLMVPFCASDPITTLYLLIPNSVVVIWCFLQFCVGFDLLLSGSAQKAKSGRKAKFSDSE